MLYLPSQVMDQTSQVRNPFYADAFSRAIYSFFCSGVTRKIFFLSSSILKSPP